MEENTEIEEKMKIALRASSVAGKRKAERLVRDKFADLEDEEATVRKALGDGMFQTAHSIHRQSASLPVLEMDLEKLVDTMMNLEFMGVLDSHIMHDFGLHKIAALDMGGEDVANDDPDIDLHEYYTYNSSWYSALTEIMDEHRRWSDDQNGLVDMGQQRDYIGYMAEHIREGVMDAIEELTDINPEREGPDRIAGPIMNRAARLFQEYANTQMSSSYAHKKWGEAFTDEAIERDDRQRDGEPQKHPRSSATLLHSLLRFNREPTEPLKSQKARGIQRLAERQGVTHIWQTMSAMWLTMEDAQNTTLPLLMETLRIMFDAQSLFVKPLYVRTCPASPRSGVLPNATATSPIDLHNAIKELYLEMTNEDSQYYDPDGALCIMEKIDAVCSAVLPVGHSIISVGFGHSAATAAEGSLMQVALSPELAQSIKDTIVALDIDDGMENHEVELVWNFDDLFLDMEQVPWSDYKKSPNVEAFVNCQKIHADRHLTAINVQVRGLHGTKEEVHGMPNVPGHEVVRGNMWAAGKSKHLTSIDVGKGDLDDCAHLEHLIDTDSVPEGGIIFVPTGTDACHAAGLALQGGIPIVYGITAPDFWGTRSWVEVAPGWVVSTETPDELTIHGWRPVEHQEWFLKGFQDGDQYWDFQNIVNGQFFHEFISGPKQDPDFVAYMAGTYTAWLVKATLAVGMGEARHAYNGQTGVFTPELGFGHLFFSNVLFGDAYGVSVDNGKSTIFHTGDQTNVAGNRTTYYYPMRHKEIGSGNLHQLLKFYESLFDCGHWGGSYGGQAYAKSLRLGADIMLFIEAMEEGEDVNFNNFLNAINLLENTQHNTAWFFNKFTSKTYLDISTAGHKSLVTIPQQYIISAAHQIRYYSSRGMEEMAHQNFLDDEKYMKQVVWPEVSHIFKGHAHSEYKELWDRVYQAVMDGDLDSLFKDYPDICGATAKHFEDSIYCDSCDSKGCGCITQLSHYHKTGDVCSNPECTNKKCVDYAITRQVEMTGLEMILAAKSVGTIKLTISTSDNYQIDTNEVSEILPQSKTKDGHTILPLHDTSVAMFSPAKPFNKSDVTDSLSHIHNYIVGGPEPSNSNSSVFTEMPTTPDVVQDQPFTVVDAVEKDIFFNKGAKMGIYTVGEEMVEEVRDKGDKAIWFLDGRREHHPEILKEFAVGMDLVYHDQILAAIEHEARRLKKVLGEERTMHLLGLLGVIQHDTYRALCGRYTGRDAPDGPFPMSPKQQRFALRLSDRHKVRYYGMGEMVDILKAYGLEQATKFFGMCWVFCNVYHSQLRSGQRFLTARNNPSAYDSFSVQIVSELCYRRVGRHMNNPMSVLLYMQRLMSREAFLPTYQNEIGLGTLTNYRQEMIAQEVEDVMVGNVSQSYYPFVHAMKALTLPHKKHWLIGGSTFMTFLRETMRRKKI